MPRESRESIICRFIIVKSTVVWIKVPSRSNTTPLTALPQNIGFLIP